MVNVTLSDGRSVQQFLEPQHTSTRLELNAHSAPPAGAYLSLGIEHIFLVNDLEANGYGIAELAPNEIFTLHPGDIISTGCPKGARIRPGDTVRARIEGVGELSANVRAGARIPLGID